MSSQLSDNRNQLRRVAQKIDSRSLAWELPEVVVAYFVAGMDSFRKNSRGNDTWSSEPITLVTTYIPYNICPDLIDEDLGSQSLYALLEKKHGFELSHGRRTIKAVAANQYEAQLLGVEEGAPLVLLDSVSYLRDGRPIEYFHAVHRGDRSRFEVKVVRGVRAGKTRWTTW